MAYVTPNFLTKKEFKAAWRRGDTIIVFNPGLGGEIKDTHNGGVTVEGPHFPRPHTWYARVQIRDGRIIKIT